MHSRNMVTRRVREEIASDSCPFRSAHCVLIAALLMTSGCFRSDNPGRNASTRVDSAARAVVTTGPEGVVKDAATPAENLTLLPSSKNRSYDAAIRDIVVREDPTVDGWKVEEFNDLRKVLLLFLLCKL